MTFDYKLTSLAELDETLRFRRVNEAVIKPLGKNNNDKNQVYAGSEFGPVGTMFEMEYGLRGMSSSQKKGGMTRGLPIPQGVIRSFVWLDTTGREIPARNVHLILYPQYREVRLSGFQTVENTSPASLSVEFIRQYPDVERYLVLGRRGDGEAVALMIVDPGPEFRAEIDALPSAPGSRIWKHLRLRETADIRLQAKLARIVGTPMPGRRLDANGLTLPFNGTQVCGYTLEHALGIIPNASSHGDFEGIELKTHTTDKVTLFTPEPDMGLYVEDFGRFMTTYGYQDDDGNWRVTGIHSVGVPCAKSKLTLRIMNYERGSSLLASADKGVHLALMDDEGTLAAGWSLERVLNCWTAKHNEAVYIPATKTACKDSAMLGAGHRFSIEFSRQILWCRDTSIERLFEALYKGTIFLDPAPKYSPDHPDLNKRRSQWRVNDIRTAAKDLYADVRSITLGASISAAT